MASDTEDDDLASLRMAALKTLKPKSQPIQQVISVSGVNRTQQDAPWEEYPASADIVPEFQYQPEPLPEPEAISISNMNIPTQSLALPMQGLHQMAARPRLWQLPFPNGMSSQRHFMPHGFPLDNRRHFNPRTPHRTFGDRGRPIHDRGGRFPRRGYVQERGGRGRNFFPRPGGPPPLVQGLQKPSDAEAAGGNLIVINPKPVEGPGTPVGNAGHGQMPAGRGGPKNQDPKKTNPGAPAKPKLVLPQDKYHSSPSVVAPVISQPTEDSAEVTKPRDKFSRYNDSDSDDDDEDEQHSDIDEITNEIDRFLNDCDNEPMATNQDVQQNDNNDREQKTVVAAVDTHKSDISEKGESDEETGEPPSPVASDADSIDLDALASGDIVFEDVPCVKVEEVNSAAGQSVEDFDGKTGNATCSDKTEVSSEPHGTDAIKDKEPGSPKSSSSSSSSSTSSSSSSDSNDSSSDDENEDGKEDGKKQNEHSHSSLLERNLSSDLLACMTSPKDGESASSPPHSATSQVSPPGHKSPKSLSKRSTSPVSSRPLSPLSPKEPVSSISPPGLEQIPRQSKTSSPGKAGKSLSPRGPPAPRQRSLSPRSHSPRHRAISPKRRLSPKQGSLSPNGPLLPRPHSRSPRRRPPRQRSTSPKRPFSPSRRKYSPHRPLSPRRSTSPKRRSISPRSRLPHRRRSTSPRRDRLSGRGSYSPRREQSSLKSSASPHRKRISPNNRAQSPYSRGDRRDRRNDRDRGRWPSRNRSKTSPSQPSDRDRYSRDNSNSRHRSRSHSRERYKKPLEVQVKNSPRRNDGAAPNQGKTRDGTAKTADPPLPQIDLEKLTPEERAKIEARRKKFGSSEVVIDPAKKVSLKSIKERPKKQKKSKQDKLPVTDNVTRKDKKEGIHKKRKKVASTNIDEEAGADTEPSLADLEDDSEDSDSGRAWKQTGHKGSVQPMPLMRSSKSKTALMSLDSGQAPRDQFRSSAGRARDKQNERNVRGRSAKDRLGQLEVATRRQAHRPGAVSDDEEDEGDLKSAANRLTSSIVRAKPFKANIPAEKLKIEVQVSPKEVKTKLKSKAKPDFSKVYSVRAKRLVVEDDEREENEVGSYVDEEEEAVPAKKMKKSKKKKKRHTREMLEEEEVDEDDDAEMENVPEIVREPVIPARPSIMDRLGKKVSLEPAGKKEKKKKRKHLDNEPVTELDVKIQKIKEKNAAIARRQREIEQDKERYG